jgi:hypothetical protein
MKGLRFGEVMSGRLAPQSYLPPEGYEDVSAVAASLCARVDIADIEGFLRSNQYHRGRLHAELAIPVLGQRRFLSDDGEFELFRLGRTPVGGFPARVMVYDAFLTDNERVYMMRGRKYLEPGPPWRLWRLWPETTRLFVTLRDVTHGGRTDVETEPVDAAVSQPPGQFPAWLQARQRSEPRFQRDFGRPKHLAGMLRLSLGGFVRQLSGMRASDAPWYQRPFVVARFMLFFSGYLARIYLRGNTRPQSEAQE